MNEPVSKVLYNDSIPAVPKIDAKAPISFLREEYEHGSASFVKEIDWLANNGYAYIRRSRGVALLLV